MRIDIKERVIFDAHPLVEVIAQIRFPKIINVNDARLTNFQEKIKVNYPFFEEFNEGDEVSYLFKSPNEDFLVSLSDKSVTLFCYQYTCWQDFISEVKQVFITAKDTYNILGVSRFGLCYKDFISRKKLQLEDSPWRDLISLWCI